MNLGLELVAAEGTGRTSYGQRKIYCGQRATQANYQEE